MAAIKHHEKIKIEFQDDMIKLGKDFLKYLHLS